MSKRGRMLVLVLGSFFCIVLGLYASGTFGTKPPQSSLLVGSYTILMNSDKPMLSFTTQESGETDLTYRGIHLAGTMQRTMSTQSTVTYTLSVKDTSVGEIDDIRFSMEVPSDGFYDDPRGTWCIRFRNASEASSGSVSNDVLLGLTLQETQEAIYTSENVPTELYDWFELYPNGTGKELNEQFIPISSGHDDLVVRARTITWQYGSNSALRLIG